MLIHSKAYSYKRNQFNPKLFNTTMPIYTSDPDSESRPSGRSFFSGERSLHAVLGGGKVADVLLWRDKYLSAAILMGVTMIWFLFEVVEYNFVSLLCHLSIVLMLILFIYYTGAGIANWNPPDIHKIMIPESTFRWLFSKMNYVLFRFYDISSGKDFGRFFVVIASLWILSVIGNYFSSLNLLYFGFLCLETIPVLYERYEMEVNYLASKGNRDVKNILKRLDSKVFNKIPRGPVKEKKFG